MAIDPLLRENARMSKIISCILVFLPLLDIYEIPILPISISEIILIFLVLYSLFLRNIILSNYAYIFFLIYAFTTSLIIANLNNYFYIDEWIFKWGRIILYSYCFLSLAPQYLNLNIFVITIKRLSVFFAIIQILQSFLWYILDIPLYFIVPGIKLHYVISDYNEYIQHLMEWGGATWRPSNFFLEPALFSFYAVVALISFLFLQKNKENLVGPILITLSIFLAGSALGIIISIIVWFMWGYHFSRKNMIRYLPLFIIIIISGILFVFIDNSVMNQVMYRVGTIGEENSSTGSLRLLRGMAIFERLPIELQILGVGLGSLKSYLVTNFIVTIYDNNLPIGNEYMNTLSYILVNTGIVGITFFIIFVGTLFYKYQEYGKRVLIICWLFFSIASSDFLSINYVYPLMLITSRSNN